MKKYMNEKMKYNKRKLLLFLFVCLIFIISVFVVFKPPQNELTTNNEHWTQIYSDLGTIKEPQSQQLRVRCHKGETQQLPNAIIIGAAKSGTSTLLNYLSINPQLKPALKPPFDETNFFNDDVLFLAGFDYYQKQMPVICNEEIEKYERMVVLEKSIYFNTFASIERIYRYDPNIKLILILRKPVKCLQSYLTHIDDIHYNRNVNRTVLNINDYFENLFNSKRDPKEINSELDNNYIVRLCNYYYSMREWMKYFSKKNFLILNGETFIHEPWKVLNQVESFLNVNQVIHQDHFRFVGKKGYYCLKPNNLSANLNKISCMNQFKGRKKKVYLSNFAKDKLKQYYENSMKLFTNLTDYNFD